MPPDAAASICPTPISTPASPARTASTSLADETYAELLHRLTGHRLADRPGPAPPEHQRVLRRGARQDVEPEGARSAQTIKASLRQHNAQQPNSNGLTNGRQLSRPEACRP